MSTSSTRSSSAASSTVKINVEASAAETTRVIVPDFKTALRLALPIFLLSRAWVAVFAYWGHFQYANVQGKYLQPFKGGWQGVPNWWLNPWTTYDAERFVHVAERGYDVVTSISFPLYSILLIPFNRSEVAMAAWGVLLSNGAFLLALAMLYRLTARDFNSLPVAKAALWATAFFPSTVIFSAVYAESLFLLLLVLTFWNARGNRWGWAALFGLLAGLTRNSGPILFVALAIEYSMQCRAAQREGRPAPSLLLALATTTPLLAFVAFQLYLKQTLGGSDLILKQANVLGRDWMLPWVPLWKEVLFVAAGRADMGTLINFWATLTGIAVAVAFWKRGVLSYTAFLGGMLLAFLTYGMTYPPYTIGAMRYLAVTCPMQQRLGLVITASLQRPMARLLLLIVALMASALVAFGFGMKSFLF
ncbi:MAG TPA: hypothetical protein VM821_03765 [Abditibacteriaceae bacterium]|nr:hypothetical protein [Abditibacteriaceae bacterium]